MIFKITAVFYHGFARERVKKRFLMSNGSADKITLRRRNQVARHLRLMLACPERNSNAESRRILPAAPFSNGINIHWVDINTDVVNP